MSELDHCKAQLEIYQILLAWQHEVLSEGQAAKALGVPRIQARIMRDEAAEKGRTLAYERANQRRQS